MSDDHICLKTVAFAAAVIWPLTCGCIGYAMGWRHAKDKFLLTWPFEFFGGGAKGGDRELTGQAGQRPEREG